ncbi:SIMPL domain-containing protein [Haloarchaeobius sp. DFWS5]|uniref:SIMPL domain-containing protein n=1 Tax=Haloarchaeobius sp. DFWS5 TaxID=3446114 RepID=UPI003EBF6291
MASRSITTSAVGVASEPPDEVTIQFSATAIEPDITSARRTVAETAADLRRLLDARGIPADRTRTVRFNVREHRPAPNEPDDREADQYLATEVVSVSLHALDDLSETLSTAVDDAGVEIGDVTFTFQTPTRRALQREAIADAVETARGKAEAAAAAEGLTVGEVVQMQTDGGSQPRQTGSGLVLDTEQSRSGPESGPIETHVTVEVEYELRDS